VTDGFLLGTAAGLALSLAIGMVPVLVVELGVRRGIAAAAAAALGVASGRVAWAAAAMVVGSAVARPADESAGPFQFIGGAVVVGVAMRGLVWILLGPRGIPANAEMPTGVAATVARLAAVIVLDPVTIAASVGLGLGLASIVAADGGSAAFVVGVAAGTVAWQAVLVATGAVAKRRIPGRVQVVGAIAGNAILVGLAALGVAR
jgi:arginine exporter protein ArgO